MSLWICHTECFAFNYHWQPGDLAESDQPPNKHFVPFEGLEGFFEVTGRKFLIEKNEATGKLQITGIWDG